MMAFVKALFAPLVSLHNDFLLYRKAKLYEIEKNYKTCYLEAFLNDRFDFTSRRIYIDDADTVAQVYLWQDEEETPLYLYQDAEEQPVFLFQDGESLGDILYDFVVFVPYDVVFDENEMRAMIATKLAGKKYKIELF